ncbi:STAS domain-containing protein [Virgisporangium aurantiacum]|nr:STAS domain-containing protein [Virgisporangium aurantiacum]
MDVLSDQPFVLRMSSSGGNLRVTVAGDLDTFRATKFREVTAVPPDGVRLIELDLARVTFLDAAGAREVVRLQRTAMRDGYGLVITAASDVVRAVLTALDREDLLPTGPTALPSPARGRWVGQASWDMRAAETPAARWCRPLGDP